MNSPIFGGFSIKQLPASIFANIIDPSSVVTDLRFSNLFSGSNHIFQRQTPVFSRFSFFLGKKNARNVSGHEFHLLDEMCSYFSRGYGIVFPSPCTLLVYKTLEGNVYIVYSIINSILSLICSSVCS